MSVSEIEAAALRLAPKDRARLAELLLESLDELSEEETETLWVQEALRRDADLDADPASGRSSADVLTRCIREAKMSGGLVPSVCRRRIE